MNRHYDVVVLGRSIGALTAAALLARRDLTVLVLGQGQRPPDYVLDRRSLRRRAFTLLAGTSPAWRRTLHELAQTPRFRRHAVTLDPMFTVLAPGRRVEVPPDPERFAFEVEREFSEVRQVVDELYATVASQNLAIDGALERDVVLPPGTWWEKFEVSRATAALGFAREDERDLLAKFPAGHPYRDFVTLPAAFSTDLAAPLGDLPTLALSRLHASWTRGVLAQEEGDLAEFLVERIEAHGGAAALDRRATAIAVKGGRVVGVLEDGEEALTGTSHVVCDLQGEVVADLAGGAGITPRARRSWPRVTATQGRFVVSLRVRRAGLPDPLSRESFWLPERGALPDPRRPALHVQRLDAPDADFADESLLVAEMLLPTRGPLTLLEAREAVLGTIREHLPFLDRHLVTIDSPHDGLPAYDYSSGARREIDRIHLSGGSGPEPMRWLWDVEPRGWLGVAGEPVRGPIPGTYLLGSTVLPGLGQEGQLLAALGVVRVITERDGTRQRMRRQLWSKIETG